MHTRNIVLRKSLPLIVSLIIAVAFLLTACGKNPGTGTGSTGNSPTPTPPPTVVQGYGTANGCPSDTVVNTAPSRPDVIVKLTDVNTTINAQVGNVIEFDLPFGRAWGAPSTSPDVLQLQTPAGYAWPAGKVCVWRFTAQSTGTAHVDFSARALCKKGQFCPQYIIEITFAIAVK
jgi:predicted small secreted protein